MLCRRFDAFRRPPHAFIVDAVIAHPRRRRDRRRRLSSSYSCSHACSGRRVASRFARCTHLHRINAFTAGGPPAAAASDDNAPRNAAMQTRLQQQQQSSAPLSSPSTTQPLVSNTLRICWVPQTQQHTAYHTPNFPTGTNKIKKGFQVYYSFRF